MNRVILIGGLGTDPKTRDTGNNNSICEFSIATSKRVNGQDQVEWHNIVVWGKRGEACQNHLRKGSKIGLVGELKTTCWNDKNTGEKKYRTQVVANEVEFLSPKSQQSGNDYPPPQNDPPYGF